MTTWYVDNAAAGTNAGTSWANAWNSFASISWGSIAAGDEIRISGGTVSKTYTTALTIGASGGAGNPITITGASDAGHNGEVIIDGATSTLINNSNAVLYNNSFTNLIIQNLTLQNCMEVCLRIAGVTTGSVIAQNLKIHTGNGTVPLVTNGTTAAANATLHFASVSAALQAAAATGNLAIVDSTTRSVIPASTYGASATATTIVMNQPATGAGVASGDTILVGMNCRAIRLDSNTATVIVRNCTCDTPNDTPAQTDTLFTSDNSGSVSVEHNIFHCNNSDPSGHSDGIQSYLDTTITYDGNLITQLGGVNNHGVNIQDVNAGGTVTLKNNVIIMGNSPGVAANKPEIALLRQFLTAGKTGVVKWHNNTVYGGLTCYETYQTAGAIPAGDEFKNNILYAAPQTTAPYSFVSGDLTTPANTDFNDVFCATDNRLLLASSDAVGAARGTVSQSTGLFYFEAQIGPTVSGGNVMLGIGNASAAVNNYAGATANSIGWAWNTGRVYLNGSWANGKFVTSAIYDLIAVAFNLTGDPATSKFWVKNITTGGGWNNDVIGNENPVGNIGGYPLTGLGAGPYFIFLSVGNTTNDSLILTAAAPFIGTLPTGFSAWGGALNPADIGGSATLTMPIAVVSGTTYRTWAAHQAAGYDANGVNSDPLFISPLDQHLQAASPARNAGTTIAAVTTDKDGRSRPAGSYDIGAYEFYVAMLAGAGSFGLAGQNAILSAAMLTGAGAFALAGQDATLTAVRFITMLAGAFGLAVPDATLTVGRVITPPPPPPPPGTRTRAGLTARYADRVEAVAIINKILDALVAFTPSQEGRTGSDFRRAVGDLRANARPSLDAGTIGTDMLSCFDAALAAGVRFDAMDLARLRILGLAPIYLTGGLMRAAAVVFAAVEQSRLVVEMEFVSRTDVRVILNRMTDMFDIIKISLADAMDSSSYQTVTALAASVASHLSATQLLLPEIVTFEFSPGQPALALSQRIYGDGSRSDELIAENNVPNPAFCPGTVRALNA